MENSGKIIQISGPAVDVQFADGHLPPIYEAIRVVSEGFNVPQPIRLLWVVPIGRARFWPGAKPRRTIADFTHYESYEPKKLRDESWIRAWPKGRAQS